MADAILHAMVYADLFDYPLTTQEIHRYLPKYSTSLAAVEELLAEHDPLRDRLGSSPPFWYLRGHEHLVALRQEREALSQALWSLAWRYGRLIATMPFVHMVAISGSLAMNNVTSPRDDLDFLIVARTGRVWLARSLVTLVVHMARRAGAELCPNYVLAEHRLQQGKASLFTAHELAQLVPLYGSKTYQSLINCNDWTAYYLPNAVPHTSSPREIGPMGHRGKRLMEGMLAGRIGDALEQWEQGRKIPRLQQEAAKQGGTEVVFSPDMCKGHMHDHATTARQRYAAHLAAQGI